MDTPSFDQGQPQMEPMPEAPRHAARTAQEEQSHHVDYYWGSSGGSVLLLCPWVAGYVLPTRVRIQQHYQPITDLPDLN